MPKRLCEIIRSHIRRFALQIISSDVRCPPILRAQEYVSVESLGRSSFAGGGSLFPPCLLAFSPSGEQSPTLCQHTRRPHSSECANALIPRYGIAACCRAFPLAGVRVPLRSHSPRHAINASTPSEKITFAGVASVPARRGVHILRGGTYIGGRDRRRADPLRGRVEKY